MSNSPLRKRTRSECADITPSSPSACPAVTTGRAVDSSANENEPPAKKTAPCASLATPSDAFDMPKETMATERVASAPQFSAPPKADDVAVEASTADARAPAACPFIVVPFSLEGCCAKFKKLIDDAKAQADARLGHDALFLPTERDVPSLQRSRRPCSFRTNVSATSPSSASPLTVNSMPFALVAPHDLSAAPSRADRCADSTMHSGGGSIFEQPAASAWSMRQSMLDDRKPLDFNPYSTPPAPRAHRMIPTDSFFRPDTMHAPTSTYAPIDPGQYLFPRSTTAMESNPNLFGDSAVLPSGVEAVYLDRAGYQEARARYQRSLAETQFGAYNLSPTRLVLMPPDVADYLLVRADPLGSSPLAGSAIRSRQFARNRPRVAPYGFARLSD